MPSPMELAASQLGRQEVQHRAALQEYLRNGGVNLDPATTAWCAAFVNSSLAQAGMKGTGSNMARSFLNYGTPVTEPQRGDIAVFSRGDPNGPYGHVGFYDGKDANGRINILAGNQGNAVSMGPQDPSRLLGYRRVDGASAPAALPATMGETVAGPAPAPVKAFGDLVKTPTTPGSAAAMPAAQGALTGIAQMFLQQSEDEAKQKQAAADDESARRRALFGGPMGGLYA